MVHEERDEVSSDRALLERFLRRREEAAFVTMVKRHGPMVLRVCRRVQGNEHDAEDAFQVTFLLLARKAGSIHKRESLASWLHGVAYRVAQEAKGQAFRRQAREKRAADLRRPSPNSDTASRELEGTVDEALRQVPERYRIPLLLCYLEERTQEEAAEQMGCPLGTVRSRLARGRDRLKEVLTRKGVCLSATGLGPPLVTSAAHTQLSSPLVTATAQAAMRYAWALPTSGMISAQARTLLEGVLKAMGTAKIKFVALVGLAAGMLALGGGGLAHQFLRQPVPAVTVEGSRDEKKMPPPISSKPAEPASSQEMSIRGRVLGPDGKALSGAKLFVTRVVREEPLNPRDIAVGLVGAAGPDGRFELSVKPTGAPRLYVVAFAPGFGVDWIELVSGKIPSDLTLRLPKDVPITGRVVNTEGRPVAGVSVSAVSLFVPRKERLDDYLAGWLVNLQDTLSTPDRRLYAPLDGITGATTTDQGGHFTLRGAGGERIVVVTFSGAGVARSTPYVITRPGFDPRPYNEVLRKKEHDNLRVLNRFLGLNPPMFTFVAEAGKTVEGVVRQAGSGKPLAGCSLRIQTGFDDGIQVVSDADGRYRIDGVPKNARGYLVSINSPKGTALLPRTAQLADSAGYAPVRLDVELAQGTVITGRVVDRQTGEGVKSGIRLAPLPGNSFFGAKPGFDNYLRDRTMQATDDKGRFRLVTIPGKALVLAQAYGAKEQLDGKPLCPYREAVPDPDYRGLFKRESGTQSWTVTTAGGIEFMSIENAVKVTDVKEDGSTEVVLYMDRGLTASVRVEDADGQPLAGAWVAGLTDHWPVTYRLTGATAPVLALNPNRPRQLAAFHPERKLGGTVLVRGDEKEPVALALGPVGSVAGRLLDADGQPLAGASVSIYGTGSIGGELYRFARPTGSPVVTGKDGRFTVNGVVPGVPFYLQMQQGKSYLGGRPKIGVRQLKPGETLDLGDRRTEPLQ
jgi:RNA polymerase sigma factor (sigma-70 family)